MGTVNWKLSSLGDTTKAKERRFIAAILRNVRRFLRSVAANESRLSSREYCSTGIVSFGSECIRGVHGHDKWSECSYARGIFPRWRRQRNKNNSKTGRTLHRRAALCGFGTRKLVACLSEIGNSRYD